MRMPVVAAQALRARMLEAGLTTEAELAALLQAVEACAADPDRVQLTFTVTQVWGRKPRR